MSHIHTMRSYNDIQKVEGSGSSVARFLFTQPLASSRNSASLVSGDKVPHKASHKASHEAPHKDTTM